MTIDLTGTWSKDVSRARGGQCVLLDYEGGLTPVVPDYKARCEETAPFEARANLAQLFNTSNYGMWGVVHWDAGDLGVIADIAVKSLTSWRQQQYRFRTDMEGTEIDVVDILQAGGSATDGTPGSGQQIQQELQLNGTAWNGRINFVGGFFSYWDEAFSGITVLVPPIPSATNSAITTDNFTWAVYGQATADVTEWLSLTAGIRYTSDHKDVLQVTTDAADPNIPEGGGSGAKTFESWTPTASVALLAPEEWIDETLVDHIMTYFTYSRGFKGGGFNATVQAQTTSTPLAPFEPETLDSFEWGLKTIALEQRVTVNVALFYGEYDDIQVTSQRTFEDEEGNVVIQRLTQNAATATTKGVEVEMQPRPIPGLALTGTLGYLDAVYDSFPFALSDLSGDVIDRSGQTFNNAPAWQTFVSAQYSFSVDVMGNDSPWLHGWVTPRVEWAYRDRYHVLGPEVSQTVQRGYNLINARLSFDFMDDRAQVGLWAKNLLDESYIDDAFQLGPVVGSAQRWYQLPRTFGGELSYRF